MQKLFITLFIGVLISLVGCSGEYYSYEPAQETPPGPGLFSGEDGVFTIYGEDSREKADGKPAAQQEEKSEQSP